MAAARFHSLQVRILIAGLLGLPLAILGLYYFFRSKSGRPYAVLGVSFVVLLIVFTLTNGKPYFFMGAYPFAFAGGAVLLEKQRWIWPSYLTGVILIGVLLAPAYAPVLLPQTFVKYYSGLTGVANGASAQQKRRCLSAIPWRSFWVGHHDGHGRTSLR